VFQQRGDAKYALKQYPDAIKDYDKAIELQEPGYVPIDE
jgi:tetratricopeptide (TPR) repeat protein